MARERTIKINIVGDAGNAAASMRTLHATMSGMGSTIKQLIGVAGLAGLINLLKDAAGASIQLARDFEISMARIRGLVGSSREQVEAWSQSILGMAAEVGQTPQELGDALYFIASAGLEAGTELEVLEVSAKAATAGLGDVKTVGDAVSSALNAYRQSGLDAAEATDILVGAIRLGKGEPAEIADTIGRVLPIAAELGVEFHEVAAATAALSNQGLDAAESTTAFRQVLATLLDPSVEAREQLDELGFSAQHVRESIREHGLLATLVDLNNAFGNNEEAASRVFGNIRALVGVLGLVGENLPGTTKIFDEMTRTAGFTDEAFNAVAETASFKLTKAMTQIKVIGTEVGSDVLPQLAEAIEANLPALEGLLRSLGGLFLSLVQLASTVSGPLSAAFTGLGHVIDGVSYIAASFAGIWDENARAQAHFIEASASLKDVILDEGDVVVGLANSLLHLARTGELSRTEFNQLAAMSGLTAEELLLVEDAVLAYARSGQEAAVTIEEVRAAFGDQNDAAMAAEVGMDRYDKMQQTTTEHAAENAGAIEEVAEEADTLANRLDNAREAQENLSEVMKEAANPVFAAVGALQDYREKLEEVNEDGKITAEEQLALAEAGFEVAESWEALDPQTTLDAMDSISEVLGITTGDVALLLEEFGIMVDESGNISMRTADGLLSGFTGLGARLAAKANFEIQSGLADLKERLGIRSPSALFADEIGYPISEGVAEGILEGMEEAESAVSDLIDSIQDRAEDDLNSALDSIGAVIGARRAERNQKEARDELAQLKKEKANLPKLIDQAKKAVADAKADLKGAKDPDERRDAERALKDAEEALNDALERRKTIDLDIVEAEENVILANLRRIETQKKMIEVGHELYNGTVEGREAFLNLADAVGISGSALKDMLDMMTQLSHMSQDFSQIIPGAPGKAPGQRTVDRYLATEPNSAARKALVDSLFDRGVIKGQREYWYGDVQGPDLENLRKAAAAKGLAKGGIAMGPTWSMIGEGGSPEAVIPLNQRGIDILAEAMKKAFGDKKGGDVYEINVYGSNIDAEELARRIAWSKRTSGV